MSAISITGARIARLDNVRPAHRRRLRRIEELKLERSLRYRCLEVSITFISGPHDVLDQILAPYNPIDDVPSYVDRLKADRGELEALFHDLLIGVTQFFRDPDAFEALKRIAFAALVSSKATGEPIRIWDPPLPHHPKCH